MHDAPSPPWTGRTVDERAAQLDDECDWLLVFIHGDLQVDHVFIDGDEITGVIDWSEAAHDDALYDLAVLTLGYPEHLDDVIAGYGATSTAT